MLTASAENVAKLFTRVGVDPFDGVDPEDLKKLDRLVEQRGQIVHTGKAPAGFYKGNAVEWCSFVEALAGQVDLAAARGAKTLVGRLPW